MKASSNDNPMDVMTKWVTTAPTRTTGRSCGTSPHMNCRYGNDTHEQNVRTETTL